MTRAPSSGPVPGRADVVTEDTARRTISNCSNWQHTMLHDAHARPMKRGQEATAQRAVSGVTLPSWPFRARQGHPSTRGEHLQPAQGQASFESDVSPAHVMFRTLRTCSTHPGALTMPAVTFQLLKPGARLRGQVLHRESGVKASQKPQERARTPGKSKAQEKT